MLRLLRWLVPSLTLLIFWLGIENQGPIYAQNAQPSQIQTVGNPTATPSQPANNGLLVTLPSAKIQQGRAGLLLAQASNLQSGTVNTIGRTFACFPTQSGLACLIAIPVDQAIKDYPVALTAISNDGASLSWNSTISVTNGQFITESFTLPSSLNYLLRDDVQANEDARLLTAYSIITPTRFWEGAFVPPVNSVSTSGFGTFRTENGVTRRHLGQDFRATVGTPVLASASGRVVLSRMLDIHGNNIVIDHGWGIYTEYAHLSERYVVPGQFVVQGQIIGLSGNTGRSTGPHVHWEVAVGDVWVNPLDFAQLQIPP